ncbi:MAG TPA: CGNR zinc finger domain-containing protein [Trebonia sp.]|jgi:predicted RNA-binding Zn ribbon-like protein|nr:CGNR zinc finger domain-containing protein [Trebonia sp.]
MSGLPDNVHCVIVIGMGPVGQTVADRARAAFRGHARLDGPRRITVTTPAGQTLTLTARHAVVVCTGSRPVFRDSAGPGRRPAFIAVQAAAFLTDSAQVARLRRCANPGRLMIFIAVNPRRSWCVPSVCGNRARVARHYRRAGGA